jgi:hypothetical protein
MTPVIRITEQVFRRLQRLGEPLVDTPSSVIERVLDHYEQTGGITNTKPSAPPPGVSASQAAPSGANANGQHNLFLVPARSMNLSVSIKNPVSLATVSKVKRIRGPTGGGV